MATPEEVYKSDTYKSVAQGRQGNHVPLAWFQDVYEALGKVLAAPYVQKPGLDAYTTDELADELFSRRFKLDG